MPYRPLDGYNKLVNLMSLSTLISKRYLRNLRQHHFFSWISQLSILGITIGIATMIIVLSVIDGFETELRERFLAANAHILAYHYPNGIEQPVLWEQAIQEDFAQEITGTSPFIHGETLTRSGHQIHSLLIKGIVPKKRQDVQSTRQIIRPLSALAELQKEQEQASSQSLPGIILGIGLLESLNASVGDTIELVSPMQKDLDPFENMTPFKIIGVYDSGLQVYDTKIGLTTLRAAQQLFQLNDTVTGLEIGLKDANQSVFIAKKMMNSYDLTIKEWQSYNHNIFAAIKQQRTLIGFIVAIVAFVASFNILTTLFVSVTQKQKDISILKSIGANNKQILSIFLKQSCLMGVTGGVLGVLLAFILSVILYNYPFINLPKVYMLAHLPVQFEWQVYLSIFTGGVFVSSIAGLYPAWLATKVTPTLGLATGRRN